MIFDELGQTATITFDMSTLEAMARACRVAAERCTDRTPYPYDTAASAFAAAAVIARSHGGMPENVTEDMAALLKKLTATDQEEVSAQEGMADEEI